MIVQVLLVAATLALAGLVLRGGAGHRQLAVRRLLGASLALGGVVAVLWPSAVTWVAHLVGVGRGTDLVLYVMVMFFLFTTASLYQRVQSLQSQLTVVVRELALAAPVRPAHPASAPELRVGGHEQVDG
ncbi:hypothetical protein ASG49_05950 [Marmoricola sp. Leaf446]|uniref:DUF2304 domain-containing protein n=1 Tax=Marmoricola sp. Leaf446 TaxID=1736379 RepID=UPI0006FD55C6|nr:DUF2304 domain-containing protein [Marmoricola sp. Leaf446]KQT94420.1 hypothetical protein ASG49_05950 [Marmoricola sp. Leaf446]